MERMWRKVNQGLISKPSASGKIRSGHQQQSVAAMLAAQQQQQQQQTVDAGAGPSSAAVASMMPSATSAFVPVPASSSSSSPATAAASSSTMMMLNGHHHQSLHHQQRSMAPVTHHQSMMRSSTGAVHRVSRRSQVPADGGSHRYAGRAAAMDGGAASSAPDQFSLHVRHPANANSITSTESRRRRRRKSKTRCNKNNSLRMNPSSSNVELIATKETSLRERAMSKFKLLNFNINWNMHITGCRPCRSNNSNIITRRLCRNRSRIDDNELYRSNSFKFERFKRKDVAGENATNTMPRPVSVCDDYSLPVDFVKKIDPNAAILGSAKSLHLPTSQTAPSPLTADIAGSAGHLDRQQQHGSEQRLPKVIAGYSHPKDHQIDVVEECESNDQLCSSANSSLPESSEDEADPPIASGRNSPESLNEDLAVTRVSTLNPSPYYYSDLLAKNQQQSQPAQPQLSGPSQSVRDEPIYAIRYKQPTTLDQRPPKKKVYSQKRYSVVEEGVHIIKCETPSTSSTSDDSNCTECRKRREQDYQDHHQQQHLPGGLHDYPLQSGQQLQRSNSADYVNELHHQLQHDDDDDDDDEDNNHESSQQHQQHHHHHHHHPQFGHPMPPHRLLDPTLCACTGSGSAGADGNADDNDDFQEIFRPRSIFYVHDDNENGCADCCLSHSDSGATGGTNTTNTTTTNTGNRSTARGRSRDRHHHHGGAGGGGSGSMKNGRCGLYETAFDSKVGRSDDDLDELSRINSRELLNDASGAGAGGSGSGRAEVKHRPRTTKHHGLRLKSSHSTDSQEFEHVRSRHPSGRHHHHHHQLSAAKCDNDAATLAQDFEQMQINAILNGDLTTSTASTTNLPSTSAAGGGSTTAAAAGPGRFQLQLQLRQQQQQQGERSLQQQQQPPSPPSTAPLPLKFSHHHHHHSSHHHHQHPHLHSTDGMFAGVPNNNQSAPDLPHHRRSATASGGGDIDPDDDCAAAAAAAASSTVVATPAPFVTPPAQQHSRLRQLRLHHHSTSGEQQGGGSSGTLHSDSSSMTGGGAGAAAVSHHRSAALRALRPHKERPQSMIVGDKKQPHPLKNKRCQLREHLRLKTNYSSTESMNTSSSGGSMESLRSSNSEGNRSTTSYESRHSTSLSSHSSDSGSRALYPLRTAALIHSKMHILSPISDKSSLEHNAEMCGEAATASGASGVASTSAAAMAEGKPQQRRLFVPNRTHLLLAGGSGEEILGSDSGISLQSRDGARSKSAFQPFSSSMVREKLNIGGGSGGVGASGGVAAGTSGLTTTSGLSMPDDIASLPFDMPKLVRRRQQLLEQKQCTSDSATSVDLGDLPFDMPKLKRRLRQTGTAAGGTTAMGIGGGLAFPMNPTLAHLMPGAHTSTESSGLSHASSSQSMRDDKLSGMFRQNLTLHFNPEPANATCLQLDVSRTSKGLHLNLAGATASAVDGIDVDVPLERQSWYHGAITRIEAENILRPLNEGCFLVRNCESSRQDFSLSLKSAKGFMHMRIQQNDAGQYILGQFSQPFGSISEIIRHYCLNRLPVRGAEHMCLLEPVAAQLL